MKKKIRDFWVSIWDKIEYRLRLLCGKPTPIKSFIVILILGIVLSVGYFYAIVSSIYDMGKHDAQKEFIEIKHIETLELPKSNDSINLLKQKMYEQQ